MKRLGLTIVQAIDAIQNLESEEQHLGVIVWENERASVRLPRHLFTGLHDERYGVDDRGVLRRLYAGSGVLEYEALMNEDGIDRSFDSFSLRKI